jgi:hypothetical protein
MKTKLFIIAMTTLGMASCASDETTSVLQDDAIEFRTGIGATSRASETVVSTLNDGFGVLALKGEASSTSKEFEFSDIFSKGAQSNVWTSSNEHTWPKYRLNFYAYYPYDANLVGSQTGASLNMQYSGKTTPVIQNFSPATDPKDQVDFVYATNGGLRSNFTSIPLVFKHGLSQIAFKAKNGNDNYIVKVLGVRIGYVKQKADFTYPEGVTAEDLTEDNAKTSRDNLWGFPTSPTIGNYESVFTSATQLGSSELDLSASGSFMIIPQTMDKWTPDESKDGAYLALLIQIVGTGKADAYAKDAIIYPNVSKYTGLPAGYGWAAVPIQADWLPGFKYTYVLDFTDGAGKVDPNKPDPDPDDNTNPAVDPDKPGDDILAHDITFTVKVEAWTALDAKEAPMDEAITTAASTNAAPAQTTGN